MFSPKTAYKGKEWPIKPGIYDWMFVECSNMSVSRYILKSSRGLARKLGMPGWTSAGLPRSENSTGRADIRVEMGQYKFRTRSIETTDINSSFSILTSPLPIYCSKMVGRRLNYLALRTAGSPMFSPQIVPHIHGAYSKCVYRGSIGPTMSPTLGTSGVARVRPNFDTRL